MTEETQEKQYDVDISIDKKTRIVNDTHGFKILTYTKISPKEKNGIKPEPYWEWKDDGYYGYMSNAINGVYHKKISETVATNLKELRVHILSVDKMFQDLFGLDVVVDEKKLGKANKAKK